MEAYPVPQPLAPRRILLKKKAGIENVTRSTPSPRLYLPGNTEYPRLTSAFSGAWDPRHYPNADGVDDIDEVWRGATDLIQASSAYRPSSNRRHSVTNGAGPSSLRGSGQQPPVEPRFPTPGDMPGAGWVSNLNPNGHGNGSADSSTGAAFLRVHRDLDDSTTPRNHAMVPELNFAEIGHGRGTNYGTDIPRGYDSLSDGRDNGTGGRSGSRRKGWRNRLTAAEHYAHLLLFGRGGNGAGGSGSGPGPSVQVLQEHDD